MKLSELTQITYSKILSNADIIKNSFLVKKLLALSHAELKGGIKSVLNHPDENPSTIVIAYDNNEPIGWAALTNGVFNVFVNHDYRKQGIGSKLREILSSV